MPAIPNHRREKYAHELAKGLTTGVAYVNAGYAENRHNAHNLAKHPEIVARVAEILEADGKLHRAATEKAAQRLSVDREWVMGRLVENVERAMQARPVTDSEGNETGEYRYEGAVANRALELLGKELGMFVDRKYVDIDGDIRGLSDATLIALLQSTAEDGAGEAGGPPVAH